MKKTANTLLLCGLLLCHFAWAQEKSPYYGYFPSKVGSDWKQLQHNIIGFAIDIPSTWTFGIKGQLPAVAALLYPESMNVSQFSAEYGQIEAGMLPFKGIPLIEAAGYTLKGMRQGHPNLVMLEEAKEQTIEGRPTVSFAFSWQSKTGFTLIEKVRLLEENKAIYSITIRATQKALDSNATLYEQILGTFASVERQY